MLKPYWRQVYVCKQCSLITLGYFALARMSKHQFKEQHEGLWHFRMKFEKPDRDNPNFGIPSEKQLTLDEEEKILSYVHRMKNVTSGIEKALINNEFGAKGCENG